MLAPHNAGLEQNGALEASLWDEWLWGSDPSEPYSPDVLMNRNQLLGLLVCRFKGRHAGAVKPAARDRTTRMELTGKEPNEMTWRELKDTLANAQREWPLFLEKLDGNPRARENLLGVKELVDGCAARFGALSECLDSTGKDQLDDTVDTEPGPDNARQLTRSAMRRMAGTLLVLYRHLHWLAVMRPVPRETDVELEITKHHHEASMSDFYLWHMHYQLPLAARLNYRHDFPGMYNHVTQPVYFHNPGYERSKRAGLEQLAEAPAIHVLPSLCQLHPEVPVLFEDEVIPADRWAWLVAAGRVYLCAPGRRVFYDRRAQRMLAVYLAETGKIK